MPRPRFQFRLSTLFWLIPAILVIAVGDWFILPILFQDALDFIQQRVIGEDAWLIWVIAAGYAVSGLVSILMIWRQRCCRRPRPSQ